MKTFIKSILRCIGVLLAGAHLARAVTPIYINAGLDNTAPQIDATAFVNTGTFLVEGLVAPYQTQNTLNYTNKGQLLGYPGYSGGFDFEYIDGVTAKRSWASSIINERGGSIVVDYSLFDGPYLILKATNLVNHGTMSISSSGLIRLEGSKVDLSRGIVEVKSTVTAGVPGYAFNLNYGEATNNTGVDPTRIIGPGNQIIRVISPAYTLETPAGATLKHAPLQIFNPLIYVYTNQVDTNRQLVDVVFVEPQTDTNVNVSVTFGTSTASFGGPTNFNNIFIQYSSAGTNIITGAPDIQQIILEDDLGTAGTATLIGGPVPYYPNTTLFSSFGTGDKFTNSNFRRDLFTKYYDTNFPKGLVLTNVPTTNLYTAVNFSLASQSAGVPSVPGASGTNFPGRVEISADSLNLEGSRIRGQGVINVRAGQITSSAGLALQAPFLYYDLGGTNGSISIKNLIGANTLRFADGTLDEFSALFTNLQSADIVSTNTMRNGDTNTPENVTNTVVFEIDFHLVFAAGQLTATQPNYVAGLTVRGDSATISDDAAPQESFRVLSKTLTLNGNLTLGRGVGRQWQATNAPNLLYFTNYGNLTAIGGGIFGTDRTNSYQTWVNYGTNLALGINVSSAYFENHGLLQTLYSAGVLVNADEAKMDGGGISGDGDVTLSGKNLKLRNAKITGKGLITLRFTDSIADAGATSPTTISAIGGISVPVKPQAGDFLGTAFSLSAPANGLGSVVWPGDNRGLSVTGFSNNVAVGQLNLLAGAGGLLSFSGTGVSNAIYVDKLVIDPGTAATLSDSVQIADNLVIYFADSNVPVEQLDGALNGHLRWISSYAGFYSGVTLRLNSGQTIMVNRSLLNSLTIDSNGNGIVNGLDPAPFDVPTPTVVLTNVPPLTTFLTFSAAPQTTYTVDYTTLLTPPNWMPLATLTNRLAIPAKLTVQDPATTNGSPRFYRVTYQP